MSEDSSKMETLKDKVVEMTKEFIQTEGGITLKDLSTLFGPGEVKVALGDLTISIA